MKRLITFLGIALIAIPYLSAQSPEQTEDWSKKPTVITPGRHGAPPSDAIILFRKSADLKNWTSRNGDAKWKKGCGTMTVNGTGDVMTREKFGSCQLHIEFRSPARAEGDGQGRGNSGVYLQTLYEVQVLDSYNNETYYNGQAGSLYKQSAPLVNSSRKPGKWQSYDIVFHAPQFASDGTLTKPATATVFHNGVLIQDHFELKGPTVYAGYPKYTPHGDMPLLLQDHGNPVSYRNIWIRKL